MVTEITGLDPATLDLTLKTLRDFVRNRLTDEMLLAWHAG